LRVVLDQRAVEALAGSDGPAKRRVRRALVAAQRLQRDAVVPTVILAELYTGGGRNQMVDAMLSREEKALLLRDTDRVLARLVGGVLAAAGAGSEDIADAHVVATAVEVGGGVVLTGDPDDLTRLAGSYRTVVVEPLPSR
jgi:predicted nucleic acid-binding protein